MKNKISGVVLKVLISVFVIVMGGNLLTFIRPEPATVKIMPFFDDVTEENRAWTEYAYMNGFILPEAESHFGVDEPISASEMAYAAIGIYENQNNIKRSFEEYNGDNAQYIAKAEEYGLCQWTDKTGNESITRAEAAAALAPLSVDAEPVEYYTGFIGMENNTYHKQVLELYNRGISLDKRINTAYSTETVLTKGDAAKLIFMLSDSGLRITDLMPDYLNMKNMLEMMMRGYQGDWSVYFEDCSLGDVISINSHQVYSASLIKLFVAQTVYTKIANGTLADSDRIENLLYRMITISDNDAWRELARILGNGSYMTGMSLVTDTAKQAGFEETGQFMQGSRKNFNFTSVDDCGVYLHKLINGEIISAQYSEKILNLLKQQQIRIKIPAGVPEGVAVANKTGELDYMQGDAAIVYAPSGTYILVIIGDSLENAGIAQAQIRELSQAVYNYLNN